MNKLLNRLSTLMLMLMSVIPMVHLLMYSFSLTADERLPIFLIVAVLFCWLMFSFWRFTLPGILICIVLIIIFYQGRNEILTMQFKDMADKMVITYYNRFVASGYSFSSTDITHTEAIFFVGFILSALMGITLNSQEDRVFLPLLISLPIIFVSLLVYGLMPAWVMLCLSAFVFLLLATGRINHPDGNTGKSFLLLVLPVAMVLGLLLLFKNPDNYDYEQQKLSLVELAQNFTQELTASLRESGDSSSVNVGLPGSSAQPLTQDEQNYQWSISGDTLDITSMPDSSSLQQILMYVTSGSSGHFYLRGNSYGAYTGTGWSTAPEYPGSSVPAFSALAVAASGLSQEAEMYISPVALDGSKLYVPYYCTREYDKESYISGSGGDYSLSFMSYTSSFSTLELPQELKNQELSYRQYVYSNYLELPQDTRSALLEIAEQNSLSSTDVYQSIAQVAEYVRTRCPYNINTQAYPSDDYAVYLLTQASEGYCVHFATAAAAMYRALGIPARMVTGLAVDLQAGVKEEILGENSHAWVEVYVDSLGWLPVEVTPGAYEGPALGGLEEEPQDSLAPQPTPQASDLSQDESSVNDRSPETQNGSETNESSADEPWSPSLSFIIFIFLLLALLIFLSRYWIKIKLWRRRLSQNRNKAAISAWRCASRICSYGAAMPEEIRSAAQRAFFGRGLNDNKQLEDSLTQLEVLRDSTYKALPWYKKLKFKFYDGLK